MSLLVEIASRADVPLESVVRVLTREPVNEEHKWRVLSILDTLGPEETRVLQRFALAAVHDAIPRPAAAVDHEAVVAELVDDPLLLPEAVRFEEPEPAAAPEPVAVEPVSVEPPEVEPAVTEEAPLPAVVESAPLVQLGSVLEELTEAVRDLRRETDAERRERVDDLAVLIDLITKGWEGVDRRLGRVERQLGRLETSEPRRALPPPLPPAAAAIEPPPVPVPPGPPAPDAPGPDPEPEPEPSGSGLRRRLPLIAVLAFGIALGALAALDLPTRFDASALIDPSDDEESAPASPRLAPPLTLQTTTDSTGSVLGETEARSRPGTTSAPTTSTRPAPTTAAPAAPTGGGTTTPQRTTAPATTGEAAAQPSFTPSRNWAWPPTANADYYQVEFFREGKLFYAAQPFEPRLTLPERVTFPPGSYRWRVRPGRGDLSENRLGAPIVDSQFTIPG